MTVTDRFGRLGDWLWFLGWAIGSAAACLATAWHTGATFDEPLHLARALDGWHTGSHAGLLQLGTMPLALDLYTLPIYLWERGHGSAFDLQRDVETLLPWFRLGPLMFWWVLLFYGRLIGRQLAGPWGGRLAVAFLACEPSFLAHASLGGTDIAVTACMVALVYHFRTSRPPPVPSPAAGRGPGWGRRLAWPTIWYAAAVLAKASGMVFGPLCMVVLEGERLARQGALRLPPRAGFRGWLRETWDLFGPLRRDLVVIIGGGMALVFVYCGSDWKPLPSFVEWAHSLPAGAASTMMVWLSEHLCIFSNAGEGLMRQVGHNMRGHGVYLLGATGPSYFWYYFPVALTMKLSIPLLLGPLVVAAVRGRALVNWALVAAAGLLVFSLNCHVQIGIRLVLPLCVLLAIGLAAAGVQAVRDIGPGWRRGLLKSSAVVGLLWTGLTAAAIWPNWLCFINGFWGGTDRGYLCLSDSNYDWGQGVPELARWRETHAAVPLDVWYFGSDPLLEELPVRHLKLHLMPIDGPEDVLTQVHGHYLAAGTTLLYGSYARGDEGKSMRNAAAFLRGRKPVARTTTFLIFDFTEPAATARAN
jgi:hypothetical protein